MGTSPLPDSLLIRCFGALAGLACLAALQAMLLPRWPRAQELQRAPIEQALGRAGFQPVALPALPATRGYELSSSTTLGYELGGGLQLRLRRGAVRERKNVQIAFIGRDRPELSLEQRHLLEGPPPTASGRVGNQPALQTCLVPEAPGAHAYGVTWEQIPAAVDRMAGGSRAALRRVIGLQPNRSYACVLISLRSTEGSPVSMATWHRLLDALEPALLPAPLHPERP